MKQLTKQTIRSIEMNGNSPQFKPLKKPVRAPLFASPWVALYLVLRNELMQARSGNE
jgi:hypothetical protein